MAGSSDVNASGPLEGADALTKKVHGINVMPGGPGAEDRVFTTYGLGLTSNGLWEIKPDGTLTLIKAGVGSDLGAYLPSRGVIPLVKYGSGLRTILFVNPDSPGTAIPSHTAYDATHNAAQSMVDDGFGGYLYTTSDGRIVSYVDASDTRHDFAGTEPWYGEGIPAVEAELRGPTHVTTDLAGNYYVYDKNNMRFRVIDQDRIITTITPNRNNEALIAGPSPSAPYIYSRYSGRNLINLDLTCALFCGNSAQTFAGSIDESDAPQNLTMDQYPNYYPNELNAAWDGDDLYVFMAITVPGGTRSTIKKIDSTNYMTTVAGESSVNVAASTAQLAFTDGTNPRHSHAGYFSATSALNFYAAMGTIFIKPDSQYIHSFEVGGNWVRQVNSGVASFVVGRDRTMYYFRGKTLYKKPYTANGSGVETTIANFTNELNSPIIRA